ncbi:MAG: hypothetical protein HY675_08315 [Chloroflexi bacterium]|nr:hypothetical protein [Chloroflexota bacterium]
MPQVITENPIINSPYAEPADIPTRTENAPIVGESSILTLDDLKKRREQEVVFLLARLVLEKYFRDDEGGIKPWLFPQLLHVAKRWLAECVTCKDNTFTQLLLLIEFAHDAADRIYGAIVTSADGEKSLRPILRPYDTLGSTRYIDFDTIRPVYPTRADRCHINYVVIDTESWEQKMAQALEEMDEVICYVKNHNLGFTIPYTIGGEDKELHSRFRRPHPRWERQHPPDNRGHWRKEKGQRCQGEHRADAPDTRRQQPRRIRAVDLFGDRGSVECEE